jgi:hypothetical protein
MPEATEGPSDEDETPTPVAKAGIEALTIIQAKKGLALTFGVSPGAVEIVIRG